MNKIDKVKEGKCITNTKLRTGTPKPKIGWIGTNPNLKPIKDGKE